MTGLAPVAADLLSATAAAFTGTTFPTLTQTYTTTGADNGTAGTGTTATTPQNGDTAGFDATGYDTAAPVLAAWIEQAIDHTK
ncbi:hypothetical protein LTT85_25515 [Nocardia asteroides]|nr:hypothetical protein LTT85_25515 [Nocardia asteroides]